MKERGMIFNAEMVRAILDGRKTQTRRPVKYQPVPSDILPALVFPRSKADTLSAHPSGYIYPHAIDEIIEMCPHGVPGDRLWVRETWADASHDDGLCICYRADKYRKDVTSNFSATFGNFGYGNWAADIENGTEGRWKPSIHMPRWASRITLKITDIRVERVQDISEEGAVSEGFQAIPGFKWHTFEQAAAGVPMHDHTAKDAFEAFWCDRYGEGSWDNNDWVWVIEFKRIESEVSG